MGRSSQRKGRAGEIELDLPGEGETYKTKTANGVTYKVEYKDGNTVVTGLAVLGNTDVQIEHEAGAMADLSYTLSATHDGNGKIADHNLRCLRRILGYGDG